MRDAEVKRLIGRVDGMRLRDSSYQNHRRSFLLIRRRIEVTVNDEFGERCWGDMLESKYGTSTRGSHTHGGILEDIKGIGTRKRETWMGKLVTVTGKEVPKRGKLTRSIG
jgi:hypothetical protein